MESGGDWPDNSRDVETLVDGSTVGGSGGITLDLERNGRDER
jgi:hypothetical protein